MDKEKGMLIKAKIQIDMRLTEIRGQVCRITESNDASLI